MPGTGTERIILSEKVIANEYIRKEYWDEKTIKNGMISR